MWHTWYVHPFFEAAAAAAAMSGAPLVPLLCVQWPRSLPVCKPQSTPWQPGPPPPCDMTRRNCCRGCLPSLSPQKQPCGFQSNSSSSLSCWLSFSLPPTFSCTAHICPNASNVAMKPGAIRCRFRRLLSPAASGSQPQSTGWGGWTNGQVWSWWPSCVSIWPGQELGGGRCLRPPPCIHMLVLCCHVSRRPQGFTVLTLPRQRSLHTPHSSPFTPGQAGQHQGLGEAVWWVAWHGWPVLPTVPLHIPTS